MLGRAPSFSVHVAVGAGSALTSIVRVMLAFSSTVASALLAPDITGAAVIKQVFTIILKC